MLAWLIRTSHVVTNNYQSNGRCSTSCAGYAFAVVQGKSCWCSNYIPADTTSAGSCSVACPGYPYESCGNESAGLFGYVALGKAPLGTQGASPSSPPSSPVEVSSDTQVIQQTQATSPTAPVVSTNSLFEPSSGPFNLPVLASSARSIAPVLRPSLPLTRSSTLIPSSSISFQTHILTQSVQNNSPNLSPVTVQDTVTASQSVEISYVSTVCSCPFVF